MTIVFPNPARSYDEGNRRIRFLGYDGVFEVTFFIGADVLLRPQGGRTGTEREYLDLFDKARAKILDAARKLYQSQRTGVIHIESQDF